MTMLVKMRLLLLMMEVFLNLKELTNILRENVESDEDVLIACHLLYAEILSTLLERTTPLRIQNYVERIIPGQTTKQFQENFRLTLGTFELLIGFMGPQLLATNKFSPSTKLMDPRKQLLSVLWLLGTPDSYRSVAERFDMGKSSVHKSFMNVVKILISHSKQIIKWPQGEAVRNITKIFESCANIPGVIGAIDGTYIAIKAPEMFPKTYVNRKCFHGITLQAVCDAHLLFTDIFTGYPSSVSDRRIFTNSDLYHNVLQRRIIFPQDHFIIGDKAYPVLSWCIVPYIEHGTLSNEEKNFNTAHAKTRQYIERAFALLKGRYRRLKYLDMSKTDFIPSVVLACCVLHNICLLKENIKEIIEGYIEQGRPSVVCEEELNYSSRENLIQDQLLEGRNLRERLMLTLRRQSTELNL